MAEYFFHVLYPFPSRGAISLTVAEWAKFYYVTGRGRLLSFYFIYLIFYIIFTKFSILFSYAFGAKLSSLFAGFTSLVP